MVFPWFRFHRGSAVVINPSPVAVLFLYTLHHLTSTTILNSSFSITSLPASDTATTTSGMPDTSNIDGKIKAYAQFHELRSVFPGDYEESYEDAMERSFPGNQARLTPDAYLRRF
jgi:hypothetical protein